MNKGRRQELKRLKFLRRVKKFNLNLADSSYNCYKNSSTPCSCHLCRGEKYRDSRNSKKNKYGK